MTPGAYVDLENNPGLSNCSFPGMRTRLVAAGLNPPTLLADINLRPLLLCDPCVLTPSMSVHSR